MQHTLLYCVAKDMYMSCIRKNIANKFLMIKIHLSTSSWFDIEFRKTWNLYSCIRIKMRRVLSWQKARSWSSRKIRLFTDWKRTHIADPDRKQKQAVYLIVWARYFISSITLQETLALVAQSSLCVMLNRHDFGFSYFIKLTYVDPTCIYRIL